MEDESRIYIPGPLEAPEEEPKTPAECLDRAGLKINEAFEQLTLLKNNSKLVINRDDLATAMQTIAKIVEQMPDLSFSTLDTFQSFVDAIGFAKSTIEAIRMDSDDYSLEHTRTARIRLAQAIELIGQAVRIKSRQSETHGLIVTKLEGLQ